jgi:hypothetical protein
MCGLWIGVGDVEVAVGLFELHPAKSRGIRSISVTRPKVGIS